MNKEVHIDSNALVHSNADIGAHTKIWAHSQVCEFAKIGKYCNVGKNVYIDNGAIVGDYCKIQNNVNIYRGVVLEDYVFCGPSMTFTNVKIPRSKYPRDIDGKFYLRTHIKEGASIGAHAVIICGITIGKNAMIGSGAVVTKDILDHALAVGNPAKQIGWVCECGNKIYEEDNFQCKMCNRIYRKTDTGLAEC